MSSQRNPSTTPSTDSATEGSVSYRRIVVKAGTGLLTHGGDPLNLKLMSTLVDQIARLHFNGVEILLVTSGAVAAGRQVLGEPRKDEDLPLRQVLAAVGQSHLMHDYQQLFSSHDIPVAQALLSRGDLTARLRSMHVRKTLLALLERRVVPIINENDVVAVEELAGDVFGDNDVLSAMVANLVDADLLVILGEIEGLYTVDPHLDHNARPIPRVERISEDIETMAGPSWGDEGRGGMATKLESAKLATAAGIGVVIASGLERNALNRLAEGESIGTFFVPAGVKIERRKRWILSRLSNKGKIQVDDGAARAIRNHNRSLLPAGVTDVLGSFERGDIVSILDSKRVQAACGISNYSSEELASIKGVHSDRIAELLGYQYGEEVVHRNNMVIL